MGKTRRCFCFGGEPPTGGAEPAEPSRPDSLDPKVCLEVMGNNLDLVEDSAGIVWAPSPPVDDGLELFAVTETVGIAAAVKQLREYHRFLRGMIPWMGYQVAVLPYTAPERLAGQSKYSFRKMVKLATDAIFSFSLVPLRIGISLGLLFLVLAAVEILYVLSFWLRGEQGILAPGWSSLMFMMLIIGGIQMIVTGFIGIYVGYIFQETKHRPTYLVKSLHVKRTDLNQSFTREQL